MEEEERKVHVRRDIESELDNLYTRIDDLHRLFTCIIFVQILIVLVVLWLLVEIQL
jgi:hypothetical protein